MSTTSKTPKSDEPRLWDRPEPKDDHRFKPYINRDPSKSATKFTPNEDAQNTWYNPPNPQPYASFGDEGVTASVSAQGDLMQFSAYLGAGTSGMFSADQLETSEPYLVRWRMEELLQLGKDQTVVDYGLEIPYHKTENSSEDEYGNDWAPEIRMTFVHDRWPRHEYDCDDGQFKLTKQWMIHKKTVLQQCLVENATQTPKTLSLRFHKGIHIRDLEYLDPSNSFNDSSDGHVQRHGPNGYSWVLSRFCEEKEANQSGGPSDLQDNSQKERRDAVAVLVTIFIDGKAVHWGELEDNIDEDIHDLNDIPLGGGSVVEVTTAYRMLLLPAMGNRSWEQFLIHPDDANVDTFLADEGLILRPGLPLNVPDNLKQALLQKETIAGIPQNALGTAKLINFLVRRNLWHILSVCSIPTHSEGDDPRFALTCGDISGHHVCTSASFFAFDFLLEVLKLIPENNDKDSGAEYREYIKYIRDKIRIVCQGHLEWLSNVQKTPDECFSANYWVTGKLMKSGSPDDALTDTAFQIIKFFQFSKAWKNRPSRPYSFILKVSRDWMARLARLDRRSKCAWPRSNVEGCDKYRLSDHIWIWKASRARHKLMNDDTPRVTNSGQPPDEEMLKSLDNRLKDPVEILKRFTTQIDTSSKRMLATTRSPRENRFLLHAGDTALLYATDLGLFDSKSPFNNPWENTLEAQRYHVDASQSGWDNSVSYALALILAIKQRSINQKSPIDLAKHSLEVLLGSTGLHGLFFGQIDEITKKLAMFRVERDRDWYFQASFEIPYLLLTNWEAIYLSLVQNEKQVEERDKTIDSKQSPKVGNMVQFWRDPGLQEDQTKNLSRLDQAKDWTIKTYVPFNSRIDQSSIVELADEWLYNYPTFLTRDERLDFEAEVIKASGPGNSIGLIVASAVERCKGNVPTSDSKSLVVDIPKKNKERRKDAHINTDYNISVENPRSDYALWQELSSVRMPEKAKKRFIWLGEASKNTPLVCTLASPAEEIQAISLFFERHSHYENHFIDDVSLVRNTWESELHLSFYQLVDDANQQFRTGIPESISLDLPRESRKKLVRGSMSFRFQGDFFDRYWTCHLIESVLNLVKDEHPFISQSKFFGEQGCLRQRKVLEIHLLDRMLKRLVDSLEQIFNNVRERLGLKSHGFSFAVLTSDDYFSSSALWQQYTQILQVVEDEISEALLTLEKWETRERDRGQERPRWTRNDESKYRPFIRKLEGTTRRRTRDLRKYHNLIKSLKETLVSNQDRVRNDLGLRGAENIRFFTYVTVMFLPLGFAASIFSMSGAPSGSIVKSMVVFAAVALILTITALVNVKSLGAAMNDIRRTVDDKSRKKKANSLLTEGPAKQTISMPKSHTGQNSDREANPTTGTTNLEDTEPRDTDVVNTESLHGSSEHSEEEAHAHLNSTGKDNLSWHIGFWLKYICIELPARRVLTGFYKLNNFEMQNPTTYTHIISGILILPIFAIGYLTQLVLYNIGDLIRVCKAGLSSLAVFKPLEDKEERKIQEQLTHFIYPLKKYRPLQNVVKENKESKEEKQRKEE